MLINKNSFLRFEDATPSPTDIADIAKGYIWDKQRCNAMPVLVAGESMIFYINTDTTLAFNPATVKLNLTNAVSGQVFLDVSPLTQHIFDADIGAYTFYAQVVIDGTVTPGIYFFTVTDTVAGDITSNFIQVINAAGNYLDYTTRCTFRHDRQFYSVPYHQLEDFYQQFRLILNEIDMQPETDKEIYNEVTTGKQRTFNNFMKLVKRVETYYFDDEAHKAAYIMFDSSQLLLNGKSYVPKAVYKITRNSTQKTNKGEIELYDEGFASVNRCTDIPTPIIPPPPVCVPVAMLGTPVLPAMNVGDVYFYSFNLSGDLPLVLANIVKPDEMELIPSGNTVNLSGTYTGAATSIPVSFDVSNCDGVNSIPFSGTIAVNHPAIIINAAITHNCFAFAGSADNAYTRLAISFSQATPIQFRLLFGVVSNTDAPSTIYSGHAIPFTPPGGASPDSYYANPSIPFLVIVPAGTTTFDTSSALIYQEGTFAFTPWLCSGQGIHLIDLYVKIDNAGYAANFTLTNGGITIHNFY